MPYCSLGFGFGWPQLKADIRSFRFCPPQAKKVHRKHLICPPQAKILGVISPDFETQAKQCLENILVVLEQAGMNFANFVKMTRFYVDIECDFVNFKSIRNHYAMKPYPARTAVEVSCLVNPLALIEVRFIAAANSWDEAIGMTKALCRETCRKSAAN